jgi:hypothetical protein
VPRFRIRTLMIVVALATIPSCGLAVLTRGSREAKMAILVLAALAVCYPAIVIAIASIASLFGRWVQGDEGIVPLPTEPLDPGGPRP